jgi:hypothetical protein
MQETPGHGAEAVEELEGVFGSLSIGRSSRDEQPQMAVNLFR